MSDIERIAGWSPSTPSCYSCSHFTAGEEWGDYGQILSCEPWCYSFDCSDDDLPGFPFDDAPMVCIAEDRYSLDLYHAFFQSPFCNDIDGSEKSMKQAFEGFVWWLENIKAVGI